MTPDSRRQIEATITQMEAQIAVLRSLLDEDCECPDSPALTVGELWARHLESLPRDARWARSVESSLKPLIARLADKRVSQLKPADVDDYVDDPEIRERYSVMTIRWQLRRLKRMISWAVDSGRIASDPLRKLRLPKPKPKRETEISPEGEAAALALMSGTMKAFFVVAIDSLMRRDEIRLMEWADIDWDQRKIRIPASRTKSRRERIGRITPRAAVALMGIPRVDGSKLVFANPETKRPYCTATIWKWWRDAVDGAGLTPAPGDESVRLHDCRGTGISRLHRLWAPVGAIQRMAGHASLTTTATYLRVDDKDADAAHALLEAHQLLAAARKGPHRAASSDRNYIEQGVAGEKQETA